MTQKKIKTIFEDKKTRNLSILIIVLGIILIGVYAVGILKYDMFGFNNNSSDDTPQTETTENEALNDSEKEPTEYVSLVREYNNINTDYVMQIVYPNLFDLPVVQTFNGLKKSDGTYYTFYSNLGNYVNDNNFNDGCDGNACNGNDVYLRKDWQSGTYSEWGSNFVDYKNIISDDDNVIIYGHHGERSYSGVSNQQFTNLDLLLNASNYKDNQYFYLVKETGVVEKYQVAVVAKIDTNNSSDLEIYRTNLNYSSDNQKDGRKQEILNYFKNKSIYDTGASLNEDDKIVTLSTCVTSNDELREVVIAKLVESNDFAQFNEMRLVDGEMVITTKE